MSDLINLPLEELRERVILIERAAVASRVIAGAGPVTIPTVGETQPVEEEKPKPKRKPRARKKPEPKPEPVEEEKTPEVEEESAEEPASEYTEQDIIDLARKVVGAKKADELKKITTKFELARIRDADEKDYPEIVKMLKAALGEDD